jgi:hypothetical protein
MVGEWMAAGFVHGVLNTDNINVTGESFDYGPWRFLPRYDPASPPPISTRPASMPSAASRGRSWHGGLPRRAFALAGPQASLYQGDAFARLEAALGAREALPQPPEAAAYFDGDGPATLLIEEVEALWAPIAERDDWSLFEAKLAQIEQARRAYAIRPVRP